MNLWLHKQVMQKLAENGAKVPNELKACDSNSGGAKIDLASRRSGSGHFPCGCERRRPLLDTRLGLGPGVYSSVGRAADS
jgi:Domain of unknown function (DUF3597)